MRLIVFLIFSFLVLPGFSFAASLVTPTPDASLLTVTDTTKPIRVDGFLVDWPETRMIVLDQKSQVTYGLLNWKSKDDFSGRVFLTYDNNYLYLSAVVQKPSGVVNKNGGMALWDGDCIELFLSTYSAGDHPKHVTKDDYHIGFSPGSDCRNPQMFCFNKETPIGGGRVSARPSLNGYILEACVPLSFFAGLEVGPGKTTRFNLALDEGGSASGNRVLQLDLSSNRDSWKNPSLWGSVQWTGKTVVSVPREDDENLYANLVVDGTKTSTYWGKHDLSGQVLDGSGKPISGATVTSWPKTQIVATDAQGRFKINKVKTYDKTVIYARMDGYATSLAPVERGVAPVTIHLSPLPACLTSADDLRSGFYGQSVEVPPGGDVASLLTGMKDQVQPLKLDYLRLVGTERLVKDTAESQLDAFVAYARQMGAEPMIELPIHSLTPEAAADWVNHCNIEKGEKVLYWTVGHEPDLYAERSQDPDLADYNVYGYINDFRVVYNAVKRVDPSVLILGPELAWRYTTGEDDWFTPFIQFDGDIVNLASFHHYAAIKALDCNPDKVMDNVRHMQTVTRGLKDRLAINSDVFIPLVLTGGNVCLESTDNTMTARWDATTPTVTPTIVVNSKAAAKPTPKLLEDAGPRSFWAALWQAEETGVLLNDSMPMAFTNYLAGNGDLDFLEAKGPRPDYWVLKMLSDAVKGKSLWAQVQNSNVSVYACQDPKTKDVVLLLINRGNDYYHPKIQLNAGDANVSVDAKLDMTFDFELPFYSVAVLQLKADHSAGKATLFTKKMALAGKPPEESVIKPW